MKYMKNKGMTCSIEGCKKESRWKGMCNAHYKRNQKHGSPDICLLAKNAGKTCKVAGCDKPAFSKLYCSQHYDSVFKHGREFLIMAPRGEGTVTKDGYREFSVGGERFLEHVRLAEQALGKPLPTDAVVHHMNEDKLDNFTPFNLVICPDQAYHMLIHKRMREYAFLRMFSENPKLRPE